MDTEFLLEYSEMGVILKIVIRIKSYEYKV